MSNERHLRISQLFSQARRLSGADRERFLDDECGSDLDLKREIKELLLSDADADLRTGAIHEEIGKTAGDFLEDLPDRVGSYQILERLGEGGMGSVLLAQQTEPVQRRVALKLIKLGMDTAAVVRRFEAERQALALMDHANVAKVLDAGVTEQGRPYFVMEYVDGVPLDEFVKAHELNIRSKLKLFVQLCEGVQHAHQKGIIHRDLKPSNILVSNDGERYTPRIIDFGIAKATQQTGEQTVVTQLGQVVGTPAYMSPEQAARSDDGVDTRSDVYSLGVVLHELLCDRLPDRSRIDRSLTGDLAWITTKALEEERDRRYASAQELAYDVRRHLEDQPVLAGPPGVGYVAQKFVRRHLSVVILSTVFLTLLIAAALFSAIKAVEATDEKRRAEQSAELAGEVSTFLSDLFDSTSPWETIGPTTTVVDMLDKGEEMAKRRASGRPLVQARLLAAVGNAYVHVEQSDKARPLFEQALELAEAEAPDAYETHEHLVDLSRLLIFDGEFDRAERLLSRAGQILSTSPNALPADRATLLARRAELASRSGEISDAVDLFRESARVWAEAGHSQAELGELANAAFAAVSSGREEDAREFVKEATARIDALDALEPIHSTILVNLSIALWRLGDYERAYEFDLQGLEIAEQYLPPDHLVIGHAASSVAVDLWYLGRREESIPYAERSLSIYEANDDHLSTAVGHYNHALTFMHSDFDDPERAMDHFRRSLKAVESGYAGTPRHTRIKVELARACRRFGEVQCVSEMLRSGYESLQAADPENDAFHEGLLLRLAVVPLGMPTIQIPPGLLEDAVRVWDETEHGDKPEASLDTLARLAVTSPSRENDGEIDSLLAELKAAGATDRRADRLLTRLYSEAACFYGESERADPYRELSRQTRGEESSARLQATDDCISGP